MAGIVFLQTENLDEITRFYRERMGMGLWLDQGGCRILRHGNMLLGFCAVDGGAGANRSGGDSGGTPSAAGLNRTGCADTTGVITFFFPRTEEVDRAYREVMDVAVSEPKHNRNFGIYHFYAKDPEGRDVEFQCFEHPIDWEFLQEG
jgi:catechol 2,3-dioxygenase-like lactoylglutathione lyase family enzyme